MTRSLSLMFVRRILAAWDAHQRHRRWSRLCQADKRLAAATENLTRHRKAHKPVRADLATIKAVMTERLRGEVR